MSQYAGFTTLQLQTLIAEALDVKRKFSIGKMIQAVGTGDKNVRFANAQTNRADLDAYIDELQNALRQAERNGGVVPALECRHPIMPWC